MNCEELLELLLDYVGGDLIVEQRTTIEVHAAECERCGILIHSYSHTVRIVRSLPRCGLSTDFETRLRQALEPHLGKE